MYSLQMESMVLKYNSDHHLSRKKQENANKWISNVFSSGLFLCFYSFQKVNVVYFGTFSEYLVEISLQEA